MFDICDSNGRVSVDLLITWGRQEIGHPGDKPETVSDDASPPSDDGDVISVIERCAKRGHLIRENSRNSRHMCAKCRAINAKIKRASVNGRALCWMAKHDAPGEGLICPCGEQPPASTSIDWVAVENAVAGRELFRPLTDAETVCTIVTVMRRWGMGPYNAKAWINANTDVELTERQVEWLIDEWAPSVGMVLETATEVFLRNMQEAELDESNPAAA